jgi:hypothetical protein
VAVSGGRPPLFFGPVRQPDPRLHPSPSCLAGSFSDRRRYAAVEAAKLGHGGVDYIARLLSCDPKTIRQGMKDLDEAEDPAAERVRKKGADARR